MVPGAEEGLAFAEELALVDWFEVAASLEKPTIGGGFDLAIIFVYDLLLAIVPC